jgi:choline dehydrogenase-like flavoprotein
LEVVLSLGAIHTPKVLMQSGFGKAPRCFETRIRDSSRMCPSEVSKKAKN